MQRLILYTRNVDSISVKCAMSTILIKHYSIGRGGDPVLKHLSLWSIQYHVNENFKPSTKIHSTNMPNTHIIKE